MGIDFQKRKVGDLEVIEVAGSSDGKYVVLFHGFGADAYNLLPLSQVYKISPSPTWIFPNGPLEVPIAPGYKGRAWFALDIEALQEALQMGDFDKISHAFSNELSESRQMGEFLLAELNVKRSHLVLGGFSQGAMVATDLALSSSERVQALLILSGILINSTHLKRNASSHAGTPFFQSHGIEDPLLPYKGAQQLERFLIENGLKGKLHPFHGGHEIPQSILLQLHSFLKTILLL